MVLLSSAVGGAMGALVVIAIIAGAFVIASNSGAGWRSRHQKAAAEHQHYKEIKLELYEGDDLTAHVVLMSSRVEVRTQPGYTAQVGSDLGLITVSILPREVRPDENSPASIGGDRLE